jgi:hypothetical protein
MALIPPDAGIRMRMQTESSLVQPLGPVKEIPSDLPELQVGQTFLARIQEGLPENTYKALVAGKMLTLQLPEGAKPGDSLELVVIDRTPRMLIAQRLEAQPAVAGAEPYPYATLSKAGQMISRLLLPEGEAPQPAPLTRGQPLLAQAPASAADIAPALAKAVGSSGLFYEAHQAQWVAGRRPLESLQAEPQGHLPPAGSAPAQAGAPAATPQPASLAATTAAPVAGERPAETSAGQATQLAQAIPDEVRPLVQQQLDAIASQRLAWHGEVWPGQTMEWEIERERTEERNAAGEDEPAARWNTTLRLSLPRLGTVDASLQLSGTGLRVRLAAADTASLADLRQASPQLAEMLTSAGLNVQAIEIQHETG